jgi:hypothetical protein
VPPRDLVKQRPPDAVIGGSALILQKRATISRKSVGRQHYWVHHAAQSAAFKEARFVV